MAQQFLDGAQVAAAAQQMGGKGVAQRMRRGRWRQAERAAQLRHAQLDQPWRQHAALDPAKQRLSGQGLNGQSSR